MDGFGRSTSGRPLSSAGWLDAHHRAKLPERMAFARRLAALKPRRVIDLGCGTGLWLDLLNGLVDVDCEFIGIDTDEGATARAKARAERWSRPHGFMTEDMTTGVETAPPGDLYLCFNVIGYLAEPIALLNQIEARRSKGGRLVLRQYDGATMRFGPMRSSDRMRMDAALYASVGGSEQFRHYEMDATLQAAESSAFAHKDVELELFQRHAPFPSDFLDYLDNTVAWNGAHMNEAGRSILNAWAASAGSAGAYFAETDLVVVLS